MSIVTKVTISAGLIFSDQGNTSAVSFGIRGEFAIGSWDTNICRIAFMFEGYSDAVSRNAIDFCVANLGSTALLSWPSADFIRVAVWDTQVALVEACIIKSACMISSALGCDCTVI
jgi:hypothetical protein